MSLAALDRLQVCHEELIGALDGHDVEAVEASVARFQGAVEEVRAAGGWRDDPDVRDRAGHIAMLGEAARARVNFLTELNRHRIDALDAVRGRSDATRYGRDGRAAR